MKDAAAPAQGLQRQLGIEIPGRRPVRGLGTSGDVYTAEQLVRLHGLAVAWLEADPHQQRGGEALQGGLSGRVCLVGEARR
ncbi:MAG: hypothetical protein R2722_02160 [Tessaracoccus sp.]